MTIMRREDGSLRKENPEVTANLESDVVKYRTAIRRAEIMASLKDHPGWIAIQEVLNEKVKAADRSLDGFQHNEHRVNDLLMQERRDFRFFLSIVDDFVGSIPGFEQKISQCERTLDARRKSTVRQD